jgi:hypothetical protein
MIYKYFNFIKYIIQFKMEKNMRNITKNKTDQDNDSFEAD